jgi:hypothetical protein
MKIAIRGFILAGCIVGLVACQNGGDDSRPQGETSLPEKTGTSWIVTLTASIPDPAADNGVAYNRLVAGQDENATDGFDNGFDLRALLTESLEAYFDHTGDMNYDPQSMQIWNDVRAMGLPQDWNIVVKAGRGAAVTLKWILPSGNVDCATNQFILVDSDGAGAQTDMCSTGSLAYTGDGQMRHFVLRVS